LIHLMSVCARCEIVLLNPNRYPEAAARGVRPWLERVVAALAPAGNPSLGVRFAGDREVRRVNRTFRGQDKATDVLSFPGTPGDGGEGGSGGDGGEGEEGGDGQSGADGGNATHGDHGGAGGRPSAAGAFHLGDILISVPAARRQAAARGWSVQHELEVLLLHGLLHCLGYDHETDGGEMERLERRLRRQWVRGERERAGGDGGA
jgi:probable rRNA maturation factor